MDTLTHTVQQDVLQTKKAATATTGTAEVEAGVAASTFAATFSAEGLTRGATIGFFYGGGGYSPTLVLLFKIGEGRRRRTGECNKRKYDACKESKTPHISR